MKKPLFVAFSALVLTGCASTMHQTALEKGAFDLNCAQEHLEVVELGIRSYGVSGCGKRVSYVMKGECSIRSSCRAEKEPIGAEK